METESMTAGVSQMRATLAALASADLDDVDDAALEAEVVELVRLRQRLGAQVSRRVARWDASKVWRRDGSRSAAARLARDTGTSPATARSIVKRGRAMGSQPAASDAWTCGQLSGDHFGILLRARGAGRAELYDRDEAFLVEHCRRLRFAQANLFIRSWIVRADAELNPDGTQSRGRALGCMIGSMMY